MSSSSSGNFPGVSLTSESEFPPLPASRNSKSSTSSATSNVTSPAVNPLPDHSISNQDSKHDSTVTRYGYVLFVEKMLGSDIIVWSDDKFFRIAWVPNVFRPFTPIIFNTEFKETTPIGRHKAKAYEAFFVSFCYSKETPFIKGSFTRKDSNRMSFSSNPGKLLTFPSISTFSIQNSPNAVFDVDTLVQFGIRPPRFVSDPPSPFIVSIKSLSEIAPTLIEPKDSILPDLFIKDLSTNPAFNLLAGIGIPDNDYIPTISFQEFIDFKDCGPIAWKRLHDIMLNKYKKLSNIDGMKKQIHSQFYNRLLKHYQNESKGLLVYSGQWKNFSPLSLIQSLLINNSKVSIFNLTFAHPLTNLSNASEMNPMLTGYMNGALSLENFLFQLPISLGEEGPDGSIHFGFAHNAHHMILSKVSLKNDKPATNMVHPPAIMPLKLYDSPEVKETGSEFNENFVSMAFVKGSKELEELKKCELLHQKVPDLANVWSAFDIYNLYSYDESIDSSSITHMLNDGALPTLLIDSISAATPCSINNKLRIIKLGSIKTMHPLNMRAFPILILQKLGLIDQAIPLSNFYFKIRLRDNVTDDSFRSMVIKINQMLKDKLYHSFFNGEETFQFSTSSSTKRNFDKSFLVVEHPPFNLKKSEIIDWISANCGPNPVPYFSEGPNGTALVVECLSPTSLLPSSFNYKGKEYKIEKLTRLPSSYKQIAWPTSDRTILKFLTNMKSSNFPPFIEDTIASLLESKEQKEQKVDTQPSRESSLSPSLSTSSSSVYSSPAVTSTTVTSTPLISSFIPPHFFSNSSTIETTPISSCTTITSLSAPTKSTLRRPPPVPLPPQSPAPEVANRSKGKRHKGDSQPSPSGTPNGWSTQKKEGQERKRNF